MKKSLFSILSAVGLTSVACASEVAVKQPEFWSPVVEHPVQQDIPQYVGYTDNVGLLSSSFDPTSVPASYIGFLQSTEAVSNWIFASVVVVTLLFAVFMLINGRAKLTEGFSGKLITRWSIGDVVLHWFVAIPCIILILSGFVIGAGKHWLAPMMSPEHFQSLVYATVCFHNIFALPFVVAAVLLMVKWVKHQLPEACDGKWFMALGGYINIGGKAKHPDAGFANAGEKAFFWTFTVFGLALSVTGLVLLFPTFFGDITKETAILALIVHVISAVVLGAFSVVHIFMGAVMSEGGLENMLSGKCDENWAKQNHNLWYAKVQQK